MINKILINPHTLLLDILEIINYQGDREQFAWEFLDLCCRKAILGSVKKLPLEKRQEIEETLQKSKNLDEYLQKIQQTISKASFQKHLEKESNIMFTQYLGSVIPKLNLSQREQLKNLLSQLAAFKFSTWPSKSI